MGGQKGMKQRDPKLEEYLTLFHKYWNHCELQTVWYWKEWQESQKLKSLSNASSIRGQLIRKYIMWNAGLNESQAGVKFARMNINNFKHSLMAESKELKSLLMGMKEKNENAGLKLNTQKTKIMASSPITSWQLDGTKVETLADFIFLASKITAVSAAMKYRCLLLGRKVMTSLDSILKSREITLPTKVCLVKPLVFPVVTYGCESWTITKAECASSGDGI